LLLYFNYSVIKKEELLAEGKFILLELVPVDPRSLMQGDYMALRYKIVGSFELQHGYCVVKLDENGVGHKLRLQEDLTPLDDDEYVIEYISTGLGMKIGAESFFFQEGEAEKYSEAKYGGLKVDQYGHSQLIGLYDEELREIKN
jgi:uncharacterized membrane-anchored protein